MYELIELTVTCDSSFKYVNGSWYIRMCLLFSLHFTLNEIYENKDCCFYKLYFLFLKLILRHRYHL